MPAIKYQMNVRVDSDTNMSLSIEGFADTEEEARELGLNHKKMVEKYLEGHNSQQ